MSDNDGKKTLGVRGGPGSVKQSFSHGRTKNVVVETKRKRVMVPKPGAAGATTGGVRGAAGATDGEMDRKLKALQRAKASEADEQKRREADEKARSDERDRRRRDIEQKAKEEAEREAAVKARAEQDARAKEAAAKKPEAAPKAPAKNDDPAAAQAALQKQQERGGRTGTPSPKTRERDDNNRANRGKGNDDGRRSGKLTVNQALSGRDGGRQRSMASMKRKQERMRQKAMGETENREKIVRDVQVPETIVVSELANRMAERAADVVKELMKMGMMVTQNQSIDVDTAELIVEEFGHKIVRVSDADVEDVIQAIEDKEEDLRGRPPVITIMGHVDHGKTSLLDIR